MDSVDIVCWRCGSKYKSHLERCPECALPKGVKAEPYCPSTDADYADNDCGPLGKCRPSTPFIVLVIALILGGAVLLITNDSDPGKGAEVMRAQAFTPVPPANSTALLGQFSQEEICIAAIAAYNLKEAKSIKSRRLDRDLFEVSYMRESDSRNFRYICKIDGNEVRWKSEDVGVLDWAKNLRIFFSTDPEGSVLNVTENFMGEAMPSKSFRKTDF